MNGTSYIFLLLVIIKIHVVNSQTFSRCGWLTMNERYNTIDLNAH